MRSPSLFLLGCLSLSGVAAADEAATSAPAALSAPTQPEEPKAATSLKYKADRGFVLKLSDDVSLRFDALAQLEATSDPDSIEAQGSAVAPRRLKLSLRGKFTDYVSVRFGVDLAPLFDLSGANAAANDDDGEFLNDASLEGKISERLFIRAGYFKTPFGRQRLNSSSALLLPNRAAATGKFTFDRGVGGLVGGALDKDLLEYQVGVTADVVLANQLNVSAVPVAVARLVLNPFGALKGDEGALKPVDSLNVSFGLNVGAPIVSNNDTGNLGVGLDAAFEFKRLFGTAEVFARSRQVEEGVTFNNDGDATAAAPNGDTQLQAGTYAQAGVLVVPKRLQLGARFGVIGFDPDFSDGNNNGKFNQQGFKTESSFGLSGFILERRLMIQGMFSHFTEQDTNNLGDVDAENIFTLQLQGAL